MQILIPMGVLTLYFGVFSLFLAGIVPEYPGNVNAAFAGRAGRIFLLATVLSFLIFVLPGKSAREIIPVPARGRGKARPGDFLLILLPLSPVVQYILNNRDILSPLGSLYVLIVVAIFSGIFIIIIPRSLGPVCSTGTLMFLGVAFTFMITGMASLSAAYNWIEAGNLKIQLIIFTAIFVIGRLLYSHLIGRKFVQYFVAGFFIINSVILLAPEGRGKALPESLAIDNKLVELVGSGFPVTRPNIYLLVYDAYVNNETMLEYGIDNSAQEEYLQAAGFKLYPRTYSIGSNSMSTMSPTLNASSEYYGSARRAVSGDGIVQNLLKSYGYETCGLFQSDYFFRGIGSSYDFSFPEVKSSHWLLVKAIFMGEFRFDVEFGRPSEEEFRHIKAKCFLNSSSRPRLVYMHSPLPNHSQNSGTCLPDETELFRERLRRANRQMTEDVETIILNDPEALILVAGDHGPYLTKNCNETGGHYHIWEISRLDIQDRFGTFLAIRWPDNDFAGYDDITVFQDIFPAVFAYLFQAPRLLQAKVEPITRYGRVISNAAVKDGIIRGGINDGEPLFLTGAGAYSR